MPEAKNAWGFVIFESDLAPHIRTSPYPRAGRTGYPAPREWFPEVFDPLGVLIEEAHAAGLRVHAAVNIFGEGLSAVSTGRAYERPEWQTIHLTADLPGPRLVASGEIGPLAWANPAHPEVPLYELAVLWELVTRYDVDGIVLDRVRYPDLSADVSVVSRTRFETSLGGAVARWPEDVITVDGSGVVHPGPLFTPWVAWRAAVIQGFVRAAEQIVHRLRPDIPLGVYVGAWYPEAFHVGQNWGAPDAPPLFPAWSPAWGRASLLPSLDYVMIGLYYREVSRLAAVRRGAPPWRSVIGGAMLGRRITGGVPLIGGLWFDLYRTDRGAGADAVRATARLTDGVMAFDLSDVEDGDWWQALNTR